MIVVKGRKIRPSSGQMKVEKRAVDVAREDPHEQQRDAGKEAPHEGQKAATHGGGLLSGLGGQGSG